jgi:hypothetical protein
MVNTKSFQHRFDRSLENLALTFTDLIILVEALDTRLERVERASEGQAEEITDLQQQLEPRASVHKESVSPIPEHQDFVNILIEKVRRLAERDATQAAGLNGLLDAALGLPLAAAVAESPTRRMIARGRPMNRAPRGRRQA